MQRSRHIKFKHLICSILLAVFTIGTLSNFVVDKAPATNESSTIKEKEADDKYLTSINLLSLTCTQTALQHQAAFLSFLYQSVCIEITPPPPDRF